MSIDMSQFHQVFFEEAAEHLATMESILLDLDIDNPNPEELNAIFRSAHSIKGGSATFGFADVAEVTHVLETLLDRLRKNELMPTTEMIDTFLESGDVLKNLLDAHNGGVEADHDAADSICGRLKVLASSENKEPEHKVQYIQQHIEEEPVIESDNSAYGFFEPDSDSNELENLFEQAKGFFVEYTPKETLEWLGDFNEWREKFSHLENVSTDCYEVFRNKSIRFRLLGVESDAEIHQVFDVNFPEGELKVGIWGDQFVQEHDEAQGYGFFAGEDKSIVESDGYGFFDDAVFGKPVTELSTESEQETTLTESSTNISTVSDDDGFGFFDDAPGIPSEVQNTAVIETQSSNSSDDDGFGFFDDMPGAPNTENATEQTQINSEEIVANIPTPTGKDKKPYGFFKPIPDKSKLGNPIIPADDSTSTPKSVVSTAKQPASSASTTNNTAKSQAPKATSAVASSSESSIRVSVEKVDQLINQVGELVITQAMLAQAASQIDAVQHESLINGLIQLERNTRDLQESVMSIRMLPISFVFSRFPRMVRDLAGKLNKKVELRTQGEGTELDKGLIEKIADPLTHLVRNSVDHGIESPEKRKANGKDEKGLILLRASHQGGNIVIEIHDDGGGLSRDKILNKAKERGLPVSDAMTDQEVFQLIFAPGFSTAEVVTDVSGRGVGMDVVRRNIESMGGRVEIDSLEGQGTRVTIRLPLTLAILDGLSVSVGNQMFIVPLTYIIESLQPIKDDVKSVASQGKVVQVRGEYLPLVSLHEVFNIKTDITEPKDGILVLLDAENKKAALFVDALRGQHQVVIKSLDTNYRKVPGVSGATIMGDGRVALILDVAALINMRSNPY